MLSILVFQSCGATTEKALSLVPTSCAFIGECNPREDSDATLLSVFKDNNQHLELTPGKQWVT